MRRAAGPGDTHLQLAVAVQLPARCGRGFKIRDRRRNRFHVRSKQAGQAEQRGLHVIDHRAIQVGENPVYAGDVLEQGL